MAKNFKTKMFEEGFNCPIADNIQPYDVILLANGKCFFVDDVDKSFVNDEIADLYDEECSSEEILPEHTLVSIYDINNEGIVNIPGNQPCIILRRIEGLINPCC